MTGWGGVYENNSTGGRWSEDEGSYHINQLELLAVYLTLQSFCSSMCNVHIRALIDNTTAVTYVNKMGGMKEKPKIYFSENTLLRKYILH